MALRTRGDGMDNTTQILNESSILGNLKFNIETSTNYPQTFKSIEPKGKIIYTIPKYVPKQCKPQNIFSKKPREPKFVPYEPYKGSVQPIIPKPHKSVFNKSEKPPRNNVAIQDLVTQMSVIRTAELIKSHKLEDDEPISKSDWEQSKLQYETDIKNLRENNAHLENQLKFQAQVNSELKTLLVAAVGEDLESRVQHLTEDKLQLARALLNSANHLTSHQEQTEWLSGQCEVWRSKFLASSLMVEELARWKAALGNRVNENQEILKGLLKETDKVKKYLCDTYKNLDQSQISDVKCNMIELTRKICEISSKLCQKNEESSNIHLKSTQYESLAHKILENPVNLPNKPDLVCNALVGAAHSTGQGQMYLQYPSMRATCCSHCKGTLQDI